MNRHHLVDISVVDTFRRKMIKKLSNCSIFDTKEIASMSGHLIGFLQYSMWINGLDDFGYSEDISAIADKYFEKLKR